MRVVRGETITEAPVEQVPRHPEVDQENTTGFESNNQILATAIDGGDSLSLQLGGHAGGVERAGKTRVEDLHVFQQAAYEHRLQPHSNRLDLRKLGH
jgi:hypothetical protein